MPGDIDSKFSAVVLIEPILQKFGDLKIAIFEPRTVLFSSDVHHLHFTLRELLQLLPLLCVLKQVRGRGFLYIFTRC